MKHVFFSCTLALLALSANAQNPLFKPADFSSSLGMSFYSGGSNGSIQDYQKAFPNSSILKQDYSGFNEGFGYLTYGSSNANIAIGFNLRDKKNSGYHANRLLRVGVNFGSSSSFSNNLFKYESVPYDTFTSSNGTMYPVDSSSSQNLSMSLEAKNILVDAALIFRTSSSKRWKLFAGLGIQGGVSFNGKATVHRSNSSYLSFPQGGSFPMGNERSTDWSVESSKVSPGFSGAVYIPMGIDWQTGTEKPFFKQLHLFYELRPILSMVTYQGFGTEVKTGVNQQFGVRVQFME